MARFADFTRADAVLRRCLAAGAGDREAVLARECGDDAELRARVEELLASAEEGGALEPGGALESPLWTTMGEDSEAASVGERMGPYRVLEEIGRGGMAVVYLAERADGAFEGQAALKVLHRGRATEEVERRFLRERQILARLRHPHICQLLDGGTSASGRVFLAMEHVEGEPIDRHCDRLELPIDARLELFRRVCQVVQFAHRNLVVHRDLKPSNILVTADGDPKLLDFGIAKLLSPDPETGELTRTSARDRVLTPQYASPEQILGEPISIATDVYALGLLLFELLTGRRARRLASPHPAEIEAAVRAETLPAPSAVVVEPPAVPGEVEAPSAEAIAARRRLTPERLRRRLAGDLDNIVSMALRREPERRYATVEQLAEDVRRHLETLPVAARPDSVGYRARKFLRRHRLGVATAALVTFLSVGFVGFHTDRVTRERDRAEREAATAKRVTDFLLDVFTRANPSDATPGGTTAMELVELGTEALEQNLAEEPEAQAAMEEVLGLVYDGFGRYDEAARLLRSSLDRRRRVFGARSPEVASSAYHLARVLWAQGDLEGAEALNREALDLYRELRDLGSEQLWLALNDLGTIRQQQGRLAAAEEIFVEVVGLTRESHPDGHLLLGGFLNNLANIRYARGDYVQAEATMREALASDRRFLTADDPGLALRVDNLASMALRAERYEDALAQAEEALEMYWQIYGQPHPHMPYAMTTIAEASFALDDPSRAEEVLTDALEMRLELLGPDHPELGLSYRHLGLHFLRQARPQEGLEPLQQALRVAGSALGEDSAAYARALWDLSRAEAALGDEGPAEARMREALTRLTAALGEDHPEVVAMRDELAPSPPPPGS